MVLKMRWQKEFLRNTDEQIEVINIGTTPQQATENQVDEQSTEAAENESVN